MRMRTLVAVLAGGAALSGCMTGPDYVRPDVAAPTQWTSPREGGESDAPVSVAAWWTTLNDPVLNQLAERSVNANLDLKIAGARVREARAARGVAASALLPSIGAAGSWTRSQTLDTPEAKQGLPFSTGLSMGPGGVTRSFTVRGQNGSITRSRTNDGSGNGETTTTSASFSPQPGQEAPDRVDDVFQVGFDAAWELDIFGGNRRAVEAAEASIDAAEERRR
ncbi:MAG: TolC family protein, partial [Candidatus Hydrogenedentes bacterium]|nr:TolC family protein [Candidatus Hydrogenedentota bacterium]